MFSFLVKFFCSSFGHQSRMIQLSTNVMLVTSSIWESFFFSTTSTERVEKHGSVSDKTPATRRCRVNCSREDQTNVTGWYFLLKVTVKAHAFVKYCRVLKGKSSILQSSIFRWYVSFRECIFVRGNRCISAGVVRFAIFGMINQCKPGNC